MGGSTAPAMGGRPPNRAAGTDLPQTRCCSALRNPGPTQNEPCEPFRTRFPGRRTRKARDRSTATAAGPCGGPGSSARPGRRRRFRFNTQARRPRGVTLRASREDLLCNPAANTDRGAAGTAGWRSEGRKSNCSYANPAKHKTETRRRPAPHLQPLSRVLQALPCFGNAFCISSSIRCTYFSSPWGVLVPQGQGIISLWHVKYVPASCFKTMCLGSRGSR